MENKVMSDEQIETLRAQIAIYGYICKKLLDVYNILTFQQHQDRPLPEVKVENTQQGGPLMSDDGQRWSSKRRWTPAQKQLEILESIFEGSGGVHPNKKKIQDITAVLSRHGQISEANVYNWFQNRRARLKRKLQVEEHDNHNNQPQVKMKMIPVDLLVLPSTSYNNNDDHATQVESMCRVNDYVRFRE